MMSLVMFAPAKAALAALFALLTACSVGAVEGPPPVDAPPSPNEATFTMQIKPITMRCVVPGCHGANLQPNLTSYGTLTTKYTTKPGSANILVTKGDHAGITYFTAADKTTMQTWIDGLQ
jgi:hypothetical protein